MRHESIICCCSSKKMCTVTAIHRPRRSRGRRRKKNLHILPSIYFLLVVVGGFSCTYAAVWVNGPEDWFFCGYKWDDDNCQSRQHCPSGNSEDCEGNEDGIKCFANTNCDTRYGDGDWFVAGKPPKQSPGGTDRPTYNGKSDNKSDHYWCGVGLDDARSKCGVHCPGGTSSECPQGNICYHDVLACDARNLIPPSTWPTSLSPSRAPMEPNPTKIPTDMPIGPPDPLPFPSKDVKDHMFCGIGIDNASAKCEVACPNANECPEGEICYFGTSCDSRTFSPTPPPTRRPTSFPTTTRPTETMLPSVSPTTSHMPTASPSEPIPTKTPTPAPSKRPTFAPMPSLQASFFCGIDWNDAIENCKRKCPSGESTECPFDEECFSLTPCTEEMGYPEDYGLVDGGLTTIGSDDCVPLQVTIVADHWPKETSWEVVLPQVENEVIAKGSSDDLVPGDPVQFLECVNNRNGCYEFIISDSGGDGICCEHGNGSYKVSYDGEEIKQGGAFYDKEITPFGLCGQTVAPTHKPTASNSSGGKGGGGGGGKLGDLAYRCVANPLIESGYVVLNNMCHLFVDCFNQHINIGDDWYCGENEQCVEVPACTIEIEDDQIDETTVENEEEKESEETDVEKNDDETAVEKDEEEGKEDDALEIVQLPIESSKLEPPTKTPIVSRPKPSSSGFISNNENNKPKTPAPMEVDATTNFPTLVPTTYKPTDGPCGGAKCNQQNHCRSKYGFCGPGATYCDDNAIWTKDCPDVEEETNLPVSIELLTPSPVAVKLDNSIEATETAPPVSPKPSTKKPVWSKPGGGGKGPGGKPKPSPSGPMTSPPSQTAEVVEDEEESAVSTPQYEWSDELEEWIQVGGDDKPAQTQSPTTHSPITPIPTDNPSLSPIEIIMTSPPSSGPTQSLSKQPTVQPTPIEPVTLSPSKPPDVESSHESAEPFGGVETETDVEPSLVTETDVESSLVVDIAVDNDTDNYQQSSTSDAWTPAHEDDCTGEPCPVSTHCRSRYGSCGPGFIYCNANSIWKKTCPPPGSRPSRNPTNKPTREAVPSASPNESAIFGNPTIKKPTLPQLPKPSLPTITDSIPHIPPSSFTATHSDNLTASVEAIFASDKTKDDQDSSSDDNEKEDILTTPKYFESATYLEEWTRSNASESPVNGKLSISIVTILLALILF